MAFKYLKDVVNKFREQVNFRLPGMTSAKTLNTQVPVFSQFGTNVHESDIVQTCIDTIATEVSKLIPKHIRTNVDGTISDDGNSNLNRLFKHGPNELMTTSDFLEKIVWLYYLNSNCFIYPIYELRSTSNTGELRYTRHYTGLYPLNPKWVTFLQDQTGAMFVEMEFENGTRVTLPYADLIHLRWKFSVNELMGGGSDGMPNNAPILKTIEINDKLLQGVSKAVETSFSIRGVLKINTMLDDETQKAERAKFEEKIRSGDSGILPLDLKADYVDLRPDPRIVDKDTLEFLDRKILRYYGVSLPIITGDFTDEQHQAFYSKTVESFVTKLDRAFTKTLFTEREKDVRNEVVFYPKNIMYMSLAKKIELLKTVGEQGLLTNDQKLGLIGYPPIGGEEGKRRTMSLNYIDVELVNEYQMAKANNRIGGADNEQGNNND